MIVDNIKINTTRRNKSKWDYSLINFDNNVFSLAWKINKIRIFVGILLKSPTCPESVEFSRMEGNKKGEEVGEECEMPDCSDLFTTK